ncbi:hypothetical protein KAR91_77100 [Candidatus Pacearchaeota archaeon]|nr:hypothetical protein [Candidatus Pacearchaeota archaeon]
MTNSKKKLTPEMLDYIAECIEGVDYGKVIIDLNGHMKTVDITVEVKKRFDKTPL